MDPKTAFVIMTLMILLNGSVLGLMHSAVLPDVRHSSVDWRIGTLLLAVAAVMYAMQESFPPQFILPLGNGCLCLGLALYWRSVRRFHGLRDTRWIFAPVVVTVLGLYYFVAFVPSLVARVVIVSACSSVCMIASGLTMYRSAPPEQPKGHYLLAGIFFVVVVFIGLRAVFFVQFAGDVKNLLDTTSWMNWAFPIVSGILPLIGTTAFLLVCAERFQGQWERAAATDFLTGLPNRRAITGHAEAVFSMAKRNRTSFALGVMDIDHFKAVNDRFGHDSGDLALKHIAGILARECRGPHRVGRQGGEEFVVILESAGVNEARSAGERLRRSIDESMFNVGGVPLALTVSIGISVISPNDSRFEDLLRRADQALYAAKQGGRNRVELSTTDSVYQK